MGTVHTNGQHASAVRLALGLDLSTQSLSFVIVRCDTLERVFSASVNFDAELSGYGTSLGMLHGDNGRVTSPTLMWVEAIDMIFERHLDALPAPYRKTDIVAMSGSAQQHSSGERVK